MAYGDLSIFTEAGKGSKDASIVAAQQKASYLSSMDQFYANLEFMEKELSSRERYQTATLAEQTREFDVTESFRQQSLTEESRRFDVRAAEEERYHDIWQEETHHEHELAGDRLEWEKTFGTKQLDLQEKELGQKSDMDEFLKEYYSKQFDVETTLKEQEMKSASISAAPKSWQAHKITGLGTTREYLPLPGYTWEGFQGGKPTIDYKKYQL